MVKFSKTGLKEVLVVLGSNTLKQQIFQTFCFAFLWVVKINPNMTHHMQSHFRSFTCSTSNFLNSVSTALIYTRTALGHPVVA